MKKKEKNSRKKEVRTMYSSIKTENKRNRKKNKKVLEHARW